MHLIKVNNFTRQISIHDIKAFFEIKKICKNVNPDIIHLHSAKAGVLGRWLLIGYYKFIFGKKVIFKRGFRSRGCFSLFVTDKAQIVFGKNVFVNNGLSISANKSVIIGDNSILGENVKIYDQNHRFRNKKFALYH
ncbi:hypothetical protein OQI88_12795 [Lactococcus lactis]|mgnify:CR=1 FL=1|uniref:glycosyltransferase n=1 Tax=Lactococcus TaxID=1357 RepID=UPI000684EE18|nr:MULTISPECIES: glycosyltransferase [Lactococcus]MDA2899885.1 hypothetical protein [Lactococcus lactis]MDH5115333.1 hypothetical protein [Lactococcus lactis]PFG88386.1 hypothetical protein BW155_12820 [Lactococcus lactis subsp. lactis]